VEANCLFRFASEGQSGIFALVPPPTTSPPFAAPPAAFVEPAVAQLDAWWLEISRHASAQPQQFLAQLPELRRAVADQARLEPADVQGVRASAWRLSEGIACFGLRENDRANAALKDALHALESILPTLATPGLPLVGRKLLGYCHMNLGSVAFNRSDLPEALRAYLHVRDIAMLAGIPRLLGQVLGNIGVVYLTAGMWEKHLEFGLESRRICREAQDDMAVGNAEINVAETYRKLRDLAASRQAAERGIEIARRHGWKNIELCGGMLLAMVDVDDNQPVVAIRRYHELASLSAEVGRPHLEATRLIALGQAHFAAGDHEAARDVLAAAIAKYAPVLTRTVHADANIALARTEVALGALAAATAHATQALDLLAATGLPNTDEIDAHEVLADVARARGDWEAACRQERARHEAYARHFNHGADLRARLLAVEHQIDIARTMAERERVERQRLEELLADVAARLAAADARPRARTAEEITAADLAPLGLTPKESEILLWVARGKTNDEIATILGRSDAVVKKHLKSIYQKLGVENRLSAAAVALRNA
jgi:DNA-binding CsgD family transcriptional regulator